MSLTLEALLTSRAGFGLTSASPLQRAICRLVDGTPLGELADAHGVLESFGVTSAAGVPGEAPAELIILSGIRAGKSLLAAALAVHASQTVDVSSLGPGEVPRVSVLSLTTDLGRVVFSHLTGNIQARPALRALLLEEPTADSVQLRHPSGRAVEVKVVAGSRAGASLVARWSAGAIFDEAPRMVGAEDGVVNFDDARAAVLGRFLPGARLVAIGSPWAPFGPIYDAVQDGFGRPTVDRVIVRAPAYRMNPVYWNPIRCAALRLRDPDVYRTDVEAEFADPDAALMTAAAIDAVTREGALELPPDPTKAYVAAIDPATRANAWPLVIGYVERRGSAPPRFVVVLAR